MSTTVGTEQNELLGKADRYLAGGGLGLFTLPLYRFAAREHLLGVEFPSAGLDAGGSEQNHSNQKRCKEFGPISSLERRLVPPIPAAVTARTAKLICQPIPDATPLWDPPRSPGARAHSRQRALLRGGPG